MNRKIIVAYAAVLALSLIGCAKREQGGIQDFGEHKFAGGAF